MYNLDTREVNTLYITDCVNSHKSHMAHDSNASVVSVTIYKRRNKTLVSAYRDLRRILYTFIRGLVGRVSREDQDSVFI